MSRSAIYNRFKESPEGNIFEEGIENITEEAEVSTRNGRGDDC